jgi:alpha-tubulin suppressor-like RCC1 family protein
MPRGQGGTLSGFTPLSTPNAPTDLAVESKVGLATVSFTAPGNTGDAAITSYIVTTIDESTGESTGVVVAGSPVNITPDPATTFKVRVQAVNDFGPGRLTEFSTGNELLTNLALYSWGRNERGQVGDNTTVNKSSPVQVGVIVTWDHVSAGLLNSHAVTSDNELYGWGDNRDGQLGDGTVTQRSSGPVRIGALTNWAQVAGGVSDFTTAAVKTDATLWTWGNNGQGQLGINLGFSNNRSSPVQVGALTGWKQVSVGGQTCAAVRTNNTLFTWGGNNAGQLGHNNTIFRSSPVQVSGTNWASVSAAFNNCVAIRTNGTIWAWGSTTYGKNGDNTNINRSSPVQIGALTNWSQVAVGDSAVAAINTSNQLFTWGGNSVGQLGVGDSTDRSSPVQVGSLTNWSKAFAGSTRNIGCVKTDQTLWVWGEGSYGALGQNDTANRNSPVQVGSASSAWVDASLGGGHVIALLGVL